MQGTRKTQVELVLCHEETCRLLVLQCVLDILFTYDFVCKMCISIVIVI
jgi:hypothetical protein